MNTLALIDFSNIFHCYFAALRDDMLSAPRSKTVGYIMSRVTEYTHVAVCLDSPPYHRSKTYPEYKGGREPKPKTFFEEMRRAVAGLQAKGVHVFAADGYEADDIIATLCFDDALADALGEHDTTIISADKDLFQLLGPDVSQISFQTGTATDVGGLLDRWGIAPAQVPDFLALQGDASDNIPGVKGVGPKTATKLIRQWGSIAGILGGIFSKPDEFKPALLENLEAAAADVMMWSRLTTLDRDAPVDALRLLEPVTPTQATAAEVPPGEHDEMDDYSDDAISASQPEATTPEHEPAILRGGLYDQRSEPAPEPESKPETPVAKGSQPRAKTKPQTSLATIDRSQRLQPVGLKQTWWLAEKIVNARLFAERFASVDEVAIVVVAGSERGWGLWASLQNIQLIKGRPAYSAQSMVALAQANPRVEYIYPVDISPKSCTYACKRKEWPEEVRRTYTYEMAERAGLTAKTRKGVDSMWAKRSEEMCFKQAGVLAARTVAADSCSGMYSPEEMSDGRVVTEVEFEVEAG